jgi:hypothetical protein
VSNRRTFPRTGLAPATSIAATSIAALALIAGCGSSAGGGSLTPSQTVTPSSSPTPTPSAPTTVPATSTAPPTAPPSTTPVEPAQFCRLSELSVTAGQGSGAAGTIYATLLFRNTGSRTCELQGYPGVAGLNAAGQQVTQAVRTPDPQGRGTAAVTLSPGTTVSAAVSGSDVPTGTATSCGTYASLLVTPPGETHSTVVTVSLPACSGLKVYPVVAGTGGM